MCLGIISSSDIYRDELRRMEGRKRKINGIPFMIIFFQFLRSQYRNLCKKSYIIEIEGHDRLGFLSYLSEKEGINILYIYISNIWLVFDF